MGRLTDYWQDLIIQHLFNISSGNTTDLFVGLLSSEPAEDASGVSEPPGKGYERVKTTATWEFVDLATGVTVQNSVVIDFPRATADWGVFPYFGIFNGNLSGSSLCAYGNLDSNIAIQNGDIARFNIGAMDVRERFPGLVQENMVSVIQSITAGVGAIDTLKALSAISISKTKHVALLQESFVWEDIVNFGFEDTTGFEFEDT